MRFVNRADAGRRLAGRLEHLRGQSLVVVGLPRGGVPVAFEVARALEAPLDIILVRKLGVPYQPELAMGAIGEEGVRVINEDIVSRCEISRRELEDVEARERGELARRADRFRRGRPPVPLAGRTVVIVDDGIATGSTALAACAVARAHGAARVVLAVPVAPPECAARIKGVVDELVCLHTPTAFFAVGQFYADFDQTSDDEVVECLERAAKLAASATNNATAADGPHLRDEEIEVVVDGTRLGGRLTIPEHAGGIVVFAHGSGSSRHSPRNRAVAAVLNEAGLGTLLFDLLTREEESDRANVFDVAGLAHRLVEVTAWVRSQSEYASLPIGYFGASTGAAAALWAAAEPGADIAAVVSRGGRPDLADARLGIVKSPTLLVVGGHDFTVLELNRKAQSMMACETSLVVIPGATHLFEEPGTLAQAASAARDWFVRHLTPN